MTAGRCPAGPLPSLNPAGDGHIDRRGRSGSTGSAARTRLGVKPQSRATSALTRQVLFRRRGGGPTHVQHVSVSSYLRIGRSHRGRRCRSGTRRSPRTRRLVVEPWWRHLLASGQELGDVVRLHQGDRRYRVHQSVLRERLAQQRSGASTARRLPLRATVQPRLLSPNTSTALRACDGRAAAAAVAAARARPRGQRGALPTPPDRVDADMADDGEATHLTDADDLQLSGVLGAADGTHDRVPLVSAVGRLLLLATDNVQRRVDPLVVLAVQLVEPRYRDPRSGGHEPVQRDAGAAGGTGQARRHHATAAGTITFTHDNG